MSTFKLVPDLCWIYYVHQPLSEMWTCCLLKQGIKTRWFRRKRKQTNNKIISLAAIFLGLWPSPCSVQPTELEKRRCRHCEAGVPHFHSKPSFLSSHCSPSLPLNPAAFGGNTNRVHPVTAAPIGLRGAFWKVISAHCSGLKYCHAALMPNCFAAPPHPSTNLQKDLYCIGFI